MRTLLVFGNCQAAWLADRLRESPSVGAEYNVIYLTDYAVIPADHPSRRAGFLATIDIALCQTAAGCRPPAFMSALRTDCRVIRFPTLWLKLLWPLYMVDPRNTAEAAHPWGRFPYGDRLALKLLGQGVTPDQLASRYRATDLNTIVNLERFAEMVTAEMENNDRKSDIAVTPYILANFRRTKIFGTVNHPTYLLLHQVYLGTLAALGPEFTATSLPVPENAADVLGAEETPLHPQIISHFKLAWAQPKMRWRYRSEFLDLEEYLKAYGEFRSIPTGNPPALQLARAQQANAFGEFPEARRILLQATITFPAHSHFLHYLALLLTRRGDLEEAEKVARYALSCFPLDAGLHRMLADILQRAGHEVAAARSLFAARNLASVATA